MVFIIDNIGNQRVVTVYDNIFQLSHGVEWQDILDNALIIIDESGKVYNWDETQTNEIATVYGYSLREIGINAQLGSLCFNKYVHENYAIEFTL